jgi:hypothetical protein
LKSSFGSTDLACGFVYRMLWNTGRNCPIPMRRLIRGLSFLQKLLVSIRIVSIRTYCISDAFFSAGLLVSLSSCTFEGMLCHSQGIEIAEADIMEDGRRTKGSRQTD